jgi:hypothetical protein
VTAHVRAQEPPPPPATEAAAPDTPQIAPVEAPPPLPVLEPTPEKRGFMYRMLHPFSGSGKKDAPPKYKDPKLRGLVLALELSPQTVKLSEVRQLAVKATLTNKGKKAVDLDFSNDQRIEIHLMNSAEIILTKWSDNHAVKEKPGHVLINPGEQIQYNENITTRELAPDKVYTTEVFFPRFPEIRVRQKFLTAP